MEIMCSYSMLALIGVSDQKTTCTNMDQFKLQSWAMIACHSESPPDKRCTYQGAHAGAILKKPEPRSPQAWPNPCILEGRLFI